MGNGYAVHSPTGEHLGTFSTPEQAEKHKQQMGYFAKLHSALSGAQTPNMSSGQAGIQPSGSLKLPKAGNMGSNF